MRTLHPGEVEARRMNYARLYGEEAAILDTAGRIARRDALPDNAIGIALNSGGAGQAIYVLSALTGGAFFNHPPISPHHWNGEDWGGPGERPQSQETKHPARCPYCGTGHALGQYKCVSCGAPL